VSELKTCPRCALDLPTEDFNFRDRAHAKLQSYCRACSNTAWRSWYSQASNRQSHRQLVSKRRQRRIARHRQIVASAKSVPCADCSGRFPTCVMDFDHLDDKTGDISRMMYSAGTDALLSEIAKCEVVCANCHRVRTQRRSRGP